MLIPDQGMICIDKQTASIQAHDAESSLILLVELCFNMHDACSICLNSGLIAKQPKFAQALTCVSLDTLVCRRKILPLPCCMFSSSLRDICIQNSSSEGFSFAHISLTNCLLADCWLGPDSVPAGLLTLHKNCCNRQAKNMLARMQVQESTMDVMRQAEPVEWRCSL